MSVWQDYLHTVSDPAHILTELTFIAVEALVISPIVALIVRAHDRRKHGTK